MKLGSLFDGSGGFPLAGALCGIEPVWASEIEPYPIAVTRSRFPNMKHLGDISKVDGGEIEPVDIITFGSPCQDLSVAGKRAGLKHTDNGDEETTRSGLFMEAVRIIKEMREKTNGEDPKLCLWENVPGAFSSNKGEDFKVVLEELIKIVEPSAVVPEVPKAGWAYSDFYCGNGWSLAYRLLDAQHWGVPQRRRRIHLVLDLRDGRAGKILFEREGLRGYFAEGRTPWQAAPADAERSVGADDREGESFDGYGGGDRGRQLDAVTLEPGIARREGGHIYEGVSGTLRANAGDNQMAVAYSVENHPNDSRVRIDNDGKVQSLTSRMGTGGGNVPMVMEPVFCLQGNGIDRADTAGCNGKGVKEDVSYTLNTVDRPAVAYGFYPQMKAESVTFTKDKACCLVNGTNPGFQNGCVQVFGDEARYIDTTHADDVVRVDDIAASLQARDYKGGKLVLNHYIVRRLTPTECARLQGFPDLWGHPDKKDALSGDEYRFWHDVRNTYEAICGRRVGTYNMKQMLTWYNNLHTDAAEYKMWGNGIALPTALYCMQGMADALMGGGDTE